MSSASINNSSILNTSHVRGKKQTVLATGSMTVRKVSLASPAIMNRNSILKRSASKENGHGTVRSKNQATHQRQIANPEANQLQAAIASAQKQPAIPQLQVGSNLNSSRCQTPSQNNTLHSKHHTAVPSKKGVKYVMANLNSSQIEQPRHHGSSSLNTSLSQLTSPMKRVSGLKEPTNFGKSARKGSVNLQSSALTSR